MITGIVVVASVLFMVNFRSGLENSSEINLLTILRLVVAALYVETAGTNAAEKAVPMADSGYYAETIVSSPLRSTEFTVRPGRAKLSYAAVMLARVFEKVNLQLLEPTTSSIDFTVMSQTLNTTCKLETRLGL